MATKTTQQQVTYWTHRVAEAEKYLQQSKDALALFEKRLEEERNG